MKYNFTAAVIGTGFIGEQHIEALVTKVDRVVACSTDAKKGRELAEKYGFVFYEDFSEMLSKEKIDIASVCVPTPLHHKFTLELLNAGINVLCEKPFASTIEQAEEMIQAAKKNSKHLMVAQCVRFSAHYEYLKRCVKEGRFGKVKHLNLYRNGPVPTWTIGNWLHDPSKSGGAVRDLHIHDTDIIRNVLGIPKNVYTMGNPLMCSTIYNYGSSDILVTSSGVWRNAAEYEFNFGYDACFESAVVTSHNGKTTVYTDNSIFDPMEKEQFPDYLSNDSFMFNEIEYFCKCVNENVPTDMCLATEVLDSLKISFCETESQNTGVPVEVVL